MTINGKRLSGKSQLGQYWLFRGWLGKVVEVHDKAGRGGDGHDWSLVAMDFELALVPVTNVEALDRLDHKVRLGEIGPVALIERVHYFTSRLRIALCGEVFTTEQVNLLLMGFINAIGEKLIAKFQNKTAGCNSAE